MRSANGSLSSDQGPQDGGYNTFQRGVLHHYQQQDEQRQGAFNAQWSAQEQRQRDLFEGEWARREQEWMQQMVDLRQQIHDDYRQRDEIEQQGHQGRRDAYGDGDSAKLKCPSLGDEDVDKDNKIGAKDYMVWRKSVDLWRLTSNVPDRRMGAHLIAALKGRARTSVMLAVDSNVLASVNGPAAVYLELDQLFLGDKASQAMSLSSELLQMRRRSGESVEDFTTRFRVAVDGCAGIGIGMHPIMMTCLLLESSGISTSERSLILATTNRSLEFNTVLSTLRQLYGKSKAVAHDSANLVETPESVMFVKNRNHPGVKGGKGAGKGGKGGAKGTSGPRVCYACGQTGHFARDCKTNPMLQNVCWKCRKPGHNSVDCTETAMYVGNEFNVEEQFRKFERLEEVKPEGKVEKMAVFAVDSGRGDGV
jgi:hypothetical protein